MSLGAKPNTNGRKGVAGQSDGEDQMLAMITALASELAIARDRIDTLERVLQAGDCLEAGALEAFRADPQAMSEKDGLRQRIIAKVFRPLRDAAQREGETRT